jgi:flagellar protein FliS
MSWKTNALAAYGRVANAETNPLQQIVMLYDGAIKFLRLAATDIEAGDLTAKAEHTNRALDIIGYLQSILDYERGGEVAPVLNNLYLGVTADILRGSAHLDSALLRRTAELLVPVREAWASNAHAATAPAATAPTPNQAPALNICPV